MGKKRSWLKTIILWVLIVGIFFFIYGYLNTCNNENITTISYSQFIKLVEDGHIEQINMEGDKISGQAENRGMFVVYVPSNDDGLLPFLREHNIQITVNHPSDYSWIGSLLIWVLIIVVFIYFLRRSMSSQMNQMNKFSESRARLADGKTRKVTFEDVAGIDEVKEEVKEVVEFLKDPKSYGKLGGRMPKGILLKGAPGTGKTLLARAVAGEAGVPFLTISGSDFVEMFVGVGASRVRDLFEKARKLGVCIIFIDELDALGKHRGSTGFSNNHDEASQTLNQLLVEMDGINSDMGIIIMAATNRPDVLDPGLTRAGRFDRLIDVPKPDLDGREAILNIYAKKIKLAPCVNLRVIAQAVPGFVGADLENLTNEAAIIATRAKKEAVEEIDYHEAIDRVGMGAARKSHRMSEEEKRLSAIHESGHAILVILQKNFNYVLRRVSIIPRGDAGGITWFMPPEDRAFETKEGLTCYLRVCLAGRAAEEIILEDISTGALNDIVKATAIARSMVCELGFGKMGPMAIGANRGNQFLGFMARDDSEVSDETKRVVDMEVNEIIEKAYREARDILKNNKETLESIAGLLMEKETISNEEVLEIVDKFGADKAKTVVCK
jgi:cell division protease FtsH